MPFFPLKFLPRLVFQRAVVSEIGVRKSEFENQHAAPRQTSSFCHLPSSFRRNGLAASALALLLVPRAAAQPLTLDRAIELALEHNQQIKVSAFSPQIARANVLAEYGRFDPAINFGRTFSETETPGAFVAPATRTIAAREDDYSLSLGGLAPWGLQYSVGGTAQNLRGSYNGLADSFTTFGGVNVTQPLLKGFGFGANLVNLRIAKANRGISDWQHKQTVIDIVTDVIFVYNNLQQAHDNLRIAILSRDLAKQLLDENEKRHRVGSMSDADVTTANARVAGREESILIAQRQVRDVENTLRELIGNTNFSVDGPDLQFTELSPAPDMNVDAAADLKVAYDSRPDYQALRLGVTINRASYAAARNQLLPQVDFVGSFGYGGADPSFAVARRQVRNEDARAYSAGVVVRIPITFAEGRGRERAARLTLKQSEADLVRKEQDIAVSVTAAAGQLETTKQRVTATRHALELQQQSLNDEQKKFKAGTSSTIFVSQEQLLLAEAESSYAGALADQRRAQASYDREIGRTLEHYHLSVTMK